MRVRIYKGVWVRVVCMCIKVTDVLVMVCVWSVSCWDSVFPRGRGTKC